jgi:uncharacterized protein (TIGR00288 family)
MSTAFSRAPHTEGMSHSAGAVPVHAPNAGLLIDFDNVTMGMRSDLSKELKNLLRSDIIRGKVTVQRAYADWRRYPQYIVPLSEASIDLIFAPAYGSSKKNATDIRMAIDGMELVFTRPEIGTYILLTGDSDFSSLVLKLKEYGKYVIGVGIQESSSDILVQNCDEYYSYTALTGLRKSGDDSRSALDPWVLVEKAVDQMVKRKDVMRSDRLKQVMLEIDGGFDEKSFGFSKFSRFLTEAAQKGLLRLRKLENGQYEITSGSDGASPAPRESRGKESGRGREDRGRDARGRADERRGGRSRDGTRSEPAAEPSAAPAAAQPTEAPRGHDAAEGAAVPPQGGRAAYQPAYDLMLQALGDLLEDQESDTVRDSDVKRRMLAIQESFDEAEMGFSKFSLFLRQAHDHEVIDLRKTDSGNYEVALPAGGTKRDGDPGGDAASSRDRGTPSMPEARKETSAERRGSRAAPPKPDEGAAVEEPARRLRPRLSSRRKGAKDEPPPLLEGQGVPVRSSTSTGRPGAPTSTGPAPTGPTPGGRTRKERSSGGGAPAGSPVGAAGVDVEALRLPTDPDAVVQYLTNSYKGVGKKTAETLVEALGDGLFPALQGDPGRIQALLPPARAEKVLEGWEADYARRSGGSQSLEGTGGDGGRSHDPSREVPASDGPPPGPEAAEGAGTGRRRGGRRTRGSGRGSR